MANDAAWEAGVRIGSERAREHRARKQALSDAQFQEKHNEIQGMIENLQTKLSYVPESDRNTPDYLKLKDQYAQAIQDRDEHWKSLDHPSEVLKFGKMLGRDLHFSKKESPVAPPVYGQPTMEVNGEKVPTGPAYKIQGPQTPAQLKAQKEANQLEAAAPLSPEQIATQNAEASTAGSLASVRSGQKAFIELNPSSTPEEQQANFSQLIQKNFGSTGRGSWTQVSGKINGQPVTLNYDKMSNRYTYPTGEAVPPEDLAPGHWVPDAKSTVFAQDQKDYEEAKKGGYKGSFEQYKAESIAKGKADVPKPLTPDQQAQAVLKKKALGQPTTKEEEATLKAAEEWINIKTTQPKIAGYQALAWSRIVSAEVPGMPGETQYVPAGIAYKNNMKAPNSLSHLMTIYYGTGKGGQDLLRFNTATHHLKMLRAAAKALDNGDIPLANQMANSYASATGKPAPTNFNAIRSAVVDEMERLYTGVGATQEGIKSMKEDVNNAQSPSQLNGYMDTDLSLMRGKIESSAQQYVMGTQGQDAFPEDIVPPAAPAVTPPSSGGNSPAKSKHYVGETVTLKNGQKLKIKIVHPDGSFE